MYAIVSGEAASKAWICFVVFFIFSLFYYNKLKSTITHIKQNSKSNSNNNKKHLSCIFLFFVHVAFYKKMLYVFYFKRGNVEFVFFFFHKKFIITICSRVSDVNEKKLTFK